MKKLIVMMLICTMLIGGAITARAEDGFVGFLNGCNWDIIEESNGSGVIYITCNDVNHTGVTIYTDNVESDEVTMDIYQNDWNDTIIEDITLNKDNWEYMFGTAMYAIYLRAII